MCQISGWQKVCFSDILARKLCLVETNEFLVHVVRDLPEFVQKSCMFYCKFPQTLGICILNIRFREKEFKNGYCSCTCAITTSIFVCILNEDQKPYPTWMFSVHMMQLLCGNNRGNQTRKAGVARCCLCMNGTLTAVHGGIWISVSLIQSHGGI